MKKFLFILMPLLLGLLSATAHTQQARVQGFITNHEGIPLEFVNVAVEPAGTGTTSNEAGFFSLGVQAGQVNLVVSHLGYVTYKISLTISTGETRRVDMVLEQAITDLPDVEVRERQIMQTDIIRLDPKLVAVLPGPTGGVEGLIKTLPGVSSTNELSAQYSVRGGNFDENLVYVNGIEIYRPFLVRAGQHEGLSFLNSDLISSIQFSAGGFDARFGDKMSSVLNIEYRKPESFAGSFAMSLLEGSMHLESPSKNKKTTFLFGVRYKSNQYLLGTLDTKGDYKPSFSDIQGLITHKLSNRLELSFLGNFSNNRYLFQPRVQTTRFGTATEVRQFTVYFDGQEVNRFSTAMGALSLNFEPTDKVHLGWTFSIFQSDETENFDILGQYWLHRVQTDMGRDDFGQPTGEALGVGSFLNHARNYLNAIVWNTEHKGHFETGNHLIRWGIKFQHENIFDRLNEWTMIDSAGYSLPRQPGHLVILQDTLFAQINLQSNRLSGFIQNTWNFSLSHGRFSFTAGARMNYWDFNRQTVFSPRSTLLYKPLALPRWGFRASAGYYHQPPFYRELRNFNGELNQNIKAQESIHFVLGSEYNFTAWNRPFKYTSEVYYKKLNNLIPYQIENVRIRYFAQNMASGYATGLDMKLNGEFVPGVESWASLSLLKTAERLNGTTEYNPRPTDQRFNFSLFFQDFLPRNPSYKVQVGFIFGTGLPFGPPDYERLTYGLRMPEYRRVDIGFSKQLVNPESNLAPRNPFRHFNNMWISAEVFNLLEMNNTISYLWIRDVENRMFAVPNYLTSRLINVKLVAYF